jgi:hypothetical protein
MMVWFGFMLLNTTFSTIYQLYRGGQFYWWSTLRKQQVTDKLYHILLYILPTTSVVIGTDCISSWIYDYGQDSPLYLMKKPL